MTTTEPTPTPAPARPATWPAAALRLGLFVAAAAAVTAYLFVAGRLRPDLADDSPGYLAFPLGDPGEALTLQRTYGYPLFLSVVTTAGGLDAVPAVQWGLHVAAVAVLWWGLTAWSRSATVALAGASPLLVSNVALRYSGMIGTDAPASSLTIAVVGLLLRAVRPPAGPSSETRPGRRSAGAWASWLAIAALVFAAYQVRPAYLTLVPTVPVVVAGLAVLLRAWRPGSVGTRRAAAAATIAVVLPLVLFCAVRWAVAGRFGLVSFGGYNFCGVVAQFLGPEDVPALPEDVRPLAEEILARRAVLAESDPRWRDGFSLGYLAMEDRWDGSTWGVNFPAAYEVYDGDWLAINDGLARLGGAIVRLEPKAYATWLVKAFFRAVYMIGSELIVHPLNLLMIGALVVLHLATVGRWLGRGGPPSAPDPATAATLAAMLGIATVFAAGQVAIVIVGSPPLGRFMDAAGVFVPVVLALAVVSKWRAWRSLPNPTS